MSSTDSSFLLLAIETSSKLGSVAIYRDETLIGDVSWERDRSHSEALTPAIESLLGQNNLQLNRFNALAVDVGPGSFTGIRVGVNAVRSLAYALNVPVYTWDATEVLARSVTWPKPSEEKPVLVAVNAQKKSLFVSEYRKGQRLSQVQLVDLEKFSTLLDSEKLIVGDGFEVLESEGFLTSGLRSKLVRLPGLSDYPLARDLGILCVENRHLRSPMDWKHVQALYLRQSGAEETRETKRRNN